MQIAHTFALPGGSAKIRQSTNAYYAQVFPDSFSKFVKCAPLAKTQQAEEVSGGFWTSFLVDLISKGLLKLAKNFVRGGGEL